MKLEATSLTPEGRFGSSKEPRAVVLFSERISMEFESAKKAVAQSGGFFFAEEILNFYDIQRSLLILDPLNPKSLWVPIFRISLLEDPRFFLFFLKRWLGTSPQKEIILFGNFPSGVEAFNNWENSTELKRFLLTCGFHVKEESHGIILKYDVTHANSVFNSMGLPSEDLKEIFFIGENPPVGVLAKFESLPGSNKRAFVSLGLGSSKDNIDQFKFGSKIDPTKFFLESYLASMDQASRALEIQKVLSLLYPELDTLWCLDFEAVLVRILQGRKTGLISKNLSIKVKCEFTHLLLEKSKKQWLPMEALPMVYFERFLIKNADTLLFENEKIKSIYEELKYEIETSKVVIQDNLNPGTSLSRDKTFQDKNLDPFLTVGIVIPCYKMEIRFLEDLIRGLNNQIWQPQQIVFVDDGSPDLESRKIQTLLESQLKIPFQFLRLKNNLGLAGARNEGLKVLTTDIVANLDADDIPLRDFVKSLQQVFQAHPKVSTVSSYTVQFKDGANWLDSKNLSNLHKPLGDGIVWGLFENSFGHANSAYRREVLEKLGGWNSSSKAMWEDWELFLKLRSQGYEIAIIPKANFLYRQRHSSMSKTYNLFEAHQRLSQSGINFSDFDQHRLRQLIVNLIFFKGEYSQPVSRLVRRIIKFFKYRTPWFFGCLKFFLNKK